MRRLLKKLKFWKRGYADYSLTEFVLLFLIFSFGTYKSAMAIRNLVIQWHFFIDIGLWFKVFFYGLASMFFVSLAGLFLLAVVVRLVERHRVNELLKRSRYVDERVSR